MGAGIAQSLNMSKHILGATGQLCETLRWPLNAALQWVLGLRSGTKVGRLHAYTRVVVHPGVSLAVADIFTGT